MELASIERIELGVAKLSINMLPVAEWICKSTPLIVSIFDPILMELQVIFALSSIITPESFMTLPVVPANRATLFIREVSGPDTPPSGRPINVASVKSTTPLKTT